MPRLYIETHETTVQSFPEIIKGGDSLVWATTNLSQFAHILKDNNNNLFGIVSPEVYFVNFPKNRELLLCTYNSKEYSLRITLFNTDSFILFYDAKSAIESFNSKIEGSIPYFNFNTNPIIEIHFKITPQSLSVDYPFPQELKIQNELLFLTKIPGLYSAEEKVYCNSAIIHLDIQNDKINIYPQDWFNKKDRDFDMVTLTNVGRAKNGRLIVSGPYIKSYMLNSTNRDIKGKEEPYGYKYNKRILNYKNKTAK
ncbi:MAG: hypothetical protein LBL61_01815 [Elusimicrobiota bacterium]|jgi:hypothetical protein|nr:hypothetical protein [Elusimicrobiota bacterium]